MKFFLVAQMPGPMHGRKVPLTIRLFTIGQSRECTLQASDPAIAELHCALETRDDKLFVHDLASPGGTFVNEVRVGENFQLHHGDRLKVGPLLFRMMVEADKKTAPVQKAKAIAKKAAPVDDQSAAAAASKLLEKYMRKKPGRRGDGVGDELS